jgi:peptidoglycan/xylan/chitin deacetylase (PgdA/CDA1 family)
MENPLFDYTPIVSRPQLELPDGARIALWIAVNVEHYTFGQPALSLAQFTAQLVPDPLNYGWRDYGPRVGVFRLMDILEKHGVPATGVVNSEACELYPQVIEEGRKRGWSWVAHGRNNSTWQTGMEPDDERAFIEAVANTIEQATGTRPKGWLGPALTSTMNTNSILAELGFTYSLDWANDDLPYDFNVKGGRLVSVPYSSEVNDIPAFVIHNHTPKQFRETLIDQFEQLYEEGGRVMGIGIHPFLVGQPFRAREFSAALAEIAARDGVWLTTADGVADWYRGVAPQP